MVVVVSWSAIAMFAQIIFQTVLLSKRTESQPYGSILSNCKFVDFLYVSLYHANVIQNYNCYIKGSSTENILRNIGLQR